MPTEAVQFLSLDEALAIHDQVVEAFGGTAGLRDPGLLESALYRPQCGCYESLEEMAAALLGSLLITRPFHEGNTRAAFFATDVFLRLNGWRMSVDAGAAHRFLAERIEAGICDLEYLVPGIRGALVRL